MATYNWSVPSGNTITGSTIIKDTDNKIQATINDLVDFVNGEGEHLNQGLTYDFLNVASEQTISGVKTFQNGLVGNLTGNVNGTASTATALYTQRSITLSGDVSGTAVFNGTANANITATVADDSHNHVIGNVDGLQTALDGKQALGSYVSTNSSQALHSTDALRISGNTLYLYKGNGTEENISLPTYESSGVQKVFDGVIYYNSGSPTISNITTTGASITNVVAFTSTYVTFDVTFVNSTYRGNMIMYPSMSAYSNGESYNSGMQIQRIDSQIIRYTINGTNMTVNGNATLGLQGII